MKYIKFDKKYGRRIPYVSFADEEYWLYSYLRHPSVDWKTALALIDEDLDRFREMADIVEEVVNFVFRGKYRREQSFNVREAEYVEFDQTTIEAEYSFYIEGRDGSPTYMLGLEMAIELVFNIYSDDENEYEEELVETEYDCWITIKLKRLRDDEITEELMDRAIDELAEIFEEPRLRDIRPEGGFKDCLWSYNLFNRMESIW